MQILESNLTTFIQAHISLLQNKEANSTVTVKSS